MKAIEPGIFKAYDIRGLYPGELDARTGTEMIALFDRLNRDGTTIVVVTHDEEMARAARRVVHMRDGAIVDDVTVRPVHDPR